MVESQDEDQEWVVLDSGADLSLLPLSSCAGVDVGGTPRFRLEDAQGKSLRIGGVRKAQLSFVQAFGASLVQSGECFLDEEFVVAKVTNTLISLGRLLKNKWVFRGFEDSDRAFVNETKYGLCAGILVSPDKVCQIPVYYKKNSLICLASVRSVTDDSVPAVRSVTVAFSINTDEFHLGWQVLANGHRVHMEVSRNFYDFSESCPVDEWKFRTTIVKVGNSWEVMELCEDVLVLPSRSDPIPGILFATTVRTFPFKSLEPLSSCMCSIQSTESLRPAGVGVGRQEPAQQQQSTEMSVEPFPRETEVPEELRTLNPLIAPPGEAGGLMENPEVITVDGKELSISSRAKDLQAGCPYFGLSQSGSKRKLFDRICDYLQNQDKRDATKLAENLQKRLLGPPV